MPQGVEYRAKLLRLHQALGEWSRADLHLSATRPGLPDWSKVCQWHTRCCRELQTAYACVLDDIIAEIEAQWGGGVPHA